MNGTYRAALGMAAGSALISFSGVFVKLVQVGPTASAFYRVLFGGIILLALSRKMLFASRVVMGWALVCGLVFALDLGVWHRSVQGVGPGLATVLANFQVFVMAGCGVLFFGERMTARLGLSIAMAMSGIVLLVGPGWAGVSADWKWGAFYGLTTAFLYTGYILTLRRLQTGSNMREMLFNLGLVSLVTALFLAPAAPALGETLAIPSPKDFFILLTYGFVGQVLGWMLISSNLPRLRVSTAGLLILLQPTLAFAWDMLFFDRPTTWLDLTGAGLALWAIYLGVTRSRNDARKS